MLTDVVTLTVGVGGNHFEGEGGRVALDPSPHE